VAILQHDFKPLVPRVIGHLLPLVDQMYDKVSCLYSKNIRTFDFDQEFIKVICDGNLEAVEEQKQFEIFFSKYNLSRHTYKAEEFNQDVLRRR
jgi:hypothetical protein